MQSWRRFRRHRLALAGSAILLGMVTMAAASPIIVSTAAVYEPDLLNIAQAPSSAHILGTDEVGRDVFARMLHGARVTLTVGLASMLLSVTCGTAIGLVAGYFGRIPDALLMRLTDVLMSIPSFFLLIVLSVVLGPSIQTIIIAIAALNWMATARIVRALALSLRSRDFVEAARAIGATGPRIITRHVFPNTIGVLTVSATLGVAAAIMTESAVSYLGLGVPAPTPSWGNMLRNAQVEMWRAPWIAIFPGVAIIMTVLSINFIGDGLRDALDPWSKQRAEL